MADQGIEQHRLVVAGQVHHAVHRNSGLRGEAQHAGAVGTSVDVVAKVHQRRIRCRAEP